MSFLEFDPGQPSLGDVEALPVVLLITYDSDLTHSEEHRHNGSPVTVHANRGRKNRRDFLVDHVVQGCRRLL